MMKRLVRFFLVFFILALAEEDVPRVLKWRKWKRPLGLVIVKSENDFETTYSTVVSALERNPNINVAAQIDHSAAANGVGLDLDPLRLVVFGNPSLGTPLMTVDQRAGIDLPQKILVWENNRGEVFLGYNPTEYLVSRFPEIEGTPTLPTIDQALANLALAATGRDVLVERHTRKIPPGLVRRSLETTKSDADFDTTLNRLRDAIERSPARIAFEIDHAANSGNMLRPTTLIVFGNPNIGTPLMQSSPSSGIDLPLKILVWEDKNGTVQVTANKVRFLRRRHRLHPRIKALKDIENAIANFIGVATKGG